MESLTWASDLIFSFMWDLIAPGFIVVGFFKHFPPSSKI